MTGDTAPLRPKRKPPRQPFTTACAVCRGGAASWCPHCCIAVCSRRCHQGRIILDLLAELFPEEVSNHPNLGMLEVGSR